MYVYMDMLHNNLRLFCSSMHLHIKWPFSVLHQETFLIIVNRLFISKECAGSLRSLIETALDFVRQSELAEVYRLAEDSKSYLLECVA